MTLVQLLQLTAEILGVIAGVAGVIALIWLFVRRNISTDVQKNQTELIQTLKDRLDIMETENKELKKSHIENARNIGELQGQVKVLRDIPLKEIAESMAKVSQSQEHIIQLLKSNGSNKGGV